MREIKFRAWDKSVKIMSQTFELFYPVSFPTHQTTWPRSSISAENFIIMQFTSLKDKNGKEIYEGDIIYGEILNLGIYEWTVEFNHAGFIAQLKNSDGIMYETIPLCHFGMTEIIGNIYENPELLK